MKLFLTYKNKKSISPEASLFDSNQLYKIMLGEIDVKDIPHKDFQYREYLTISTKVTNKTVNLFNVMKDSIIEKTNLMLNFFHDNPTFIDHKDQFYTKFSIPKQKGGFRNLINPRSDLKQLQRVLLDFMNNSLGIIPHNAAHAFREKRDAITNATVHKNSKYIVSMDLKDFFPSISSTILKKKLKNISLLAIEDLVIDSFIACLIEIATFEDCLPQGSPLSPYLSNLVMIEFDYAIDKGMQKKHIPYYWYTRYADDLTFSSKNYHSHKNLINFVTGILNTCFGDDIQLNTKKTKVLKNTGKCYITGAKLNKDNNITIGHEKKTKIKHDLFNLFVNHKNGNASREEIQSTLGMISYMHRIEPEYTDYLVKKMLKKFNSNEYTLAKHFNL